MGPMGLATEHVAKDTRNMTVSQARALPPYFNGPKINNRYEQVLTAPRGGLAGLSNFADLYQRTPEKLWQSVRYSAPRMKLDVGTPATRQQFSKLIGQ